MSAPGDKVRRPNRKKDTMTQEAETKMVEVTRESVHMKNELTLPEYGESEQFRYAKWKIAMAYGYLAFASVISIGAVLMNPTLDVRLVALALWGATSAVVAVLLRKEYRKKL